MQLTLDRETAVLDREGHEPVTVHVEKIDDETYNIDWSPVDERWGQSQLQFGCMEGTPGLIEAKGKFWKMHAVLPDTAVQSAHGWREDHAREYRAGRRGLRTGASPASAASSTKPDVTRNCPGQREDNSAEASAESGVTPDQQQAQDAAEPSGVTHRGKSGVEGRAVSGVDFISRCDRAKGMSWLRWCPRLV